MIKIKYIIDYHDIPLSGMSEYNGRLHFFENVSLSIDEKVYNLHYLNDREIADEVGRHLLFTTHVGTHWDNIPEEEQIVHPMVFWTNYYDSFSTSIVPFIYDEYSKRKPVLSFRLIGKRGSYKGEIING